MPELEEPKISPYGLKKPKRKKYVFILEDEESNPGQKTSITLLDPTISVLIEAEQVSSKYKEMFNEIDAETGEKVSPPLIDDGEGKLTPVSTDDAFIELAASINCLQVKPARYDTIELMIFLETMELSMVKVIAKTKELTDRYTSILANPTPAAITPQSPRTINDQEDT